MKRACFLHLLFTLRLLASPLAEADTLFIQEHHTPLLIGDSAKANDIRSLAFLADRTVCAATGAGLYHYDPSSRVWLRKTEGPAFSLAADSLGVLWAGAWDGLYRWNGEAYEKHPIVHSTVSAVLALKDRVLALGPTGFYQASSTRAEKIHLPFSRDVHSLKPDNSGGYYIATSRGLFHQQNSGARVLQNETELLSAWVTDVEYAADGKLWISGMGGITLYEGDRRFGQFTPAEGLASIYVNCLRLAPNGAMWIGTRHGVIRHHHGAWSLRHSKRWLCGDDVRDIVFDQNGSAWIATNAGVSVLSTRPMSLSAKANHYHRVLQARHVRPPYLVEKCRLAVPGDTLTWQPLDNDNDGQYTGMYLAMESFRYAVTREATARENASKAFNALHFLQTVTGSKGFVARTVIPSDWTTMADPNRSIDDQEWAERLVRNPREKRRENLWRLSQDQRWLWKGDTSSDEITGHMYGYLFYHDLVADAMEKRRISNHVCRIVDYIIEHGFVLTDIDGQHTTWGVWAPERLNEDPDWAAERGINSLEMLSYLKLAHHLSGKSRYQQIYLDLLHTHHYGQNVLTAKTTNPAWTTHIDDELLALAFPCLLLHEKDPSIKSIYLKSLEQWYESAERDQSPFFNFTYAALSGDDPRLESSLFFLRDTSWDLRRWRINNGWRADVAPCYFPELERVQLNRLAPISERSFFRWDDNPWYPEDGDDGATESDGVFWLLPYWMGRYYGFL
ncbi:MAG TPA: regulator [bacterium]|nr:regulator [bacterium]HPN33038.1 regulator [bacterium]